MATHNNLTEEKMATHGHDHAVTGDNSSGSRDHDFVEKFEHMEPGYGHHDGENKLERKYTELDDPNIHQSVCAQYVKVVGRHFLTAPR